MQWAAENALGADCHSRSRLSVSDSQHPGRFTPRNVQGASLQWATEKTTRVTVDGKRGRGRWHVSRRHRPHTSCTACSVDLIPEGATPCREKCITSYWLVAPMSVLDVTA